MVEAKDERRRVRVGEVDQVRSRRRVLEVEREEMLRAERPLRVRVGEDGMATETI